MLGWIAWTLIAVTIVVGDPLRILVATIAPTALNLLDLRWVLLLVLLALVLLLFKVRTLGLGIAYVAVFPLVVIFWKVPRALIRRRSATLIIAVVGIAASISARARLFVVALALACLSAVLIAAAGNAVLIAAGMFGLLVALLWWFVITCIDLLRSTAFLRAQQRFLKWVSSLAIIESLVTPDYPDVVTLKTWTVEDAKKFRDTAGNALVAHRTLGLWARSIDSYRRGPSVVILNGIVVLGLFIQLVVAFSFLHYGVYLIDSAQFAFERTPDSATFVNYSATAIYFGETSALVPAGTLATVVKIGNGVIGSLGLLIVVGSMLIAFRANRADTNAVSIIRDLRDKQREIEDSAAEAHGMPLQDLELRLAAASWGLLGAIAWMTKLAPASWQDEDRTD